jgi:hypothetical protein
LDNALGIFTKSPMEVLENSQLEMGANYLIADGEVYQVIVWVNGGIASRSHWTPEDANYFSHYMAAVNNPHTLYRQRKW